MYVKVCRKSTECKCTSILFCYPDIFTATSVIVTGSVKSLPYVPLLDSFEEYTEDSWTYDGRYKHVTIISM